MSDALKPCPFCGDHDIEIREARYGHCLLCGAEGPYSESDENEAIELWNTRGRTLDADAIMACLKDIEAKHSKPYDPEKSDEDWTQYDLGYVHAIQLVQMWVSQQMKKT